VTLPQYLHFECHGFYSNIFVMIFLAVWLNYCVFCSYWRREETECQLVDRATGSVAICHKASTLYLLHVYYLLCVVSFRISLKLVLGLISPGWHSIAYFFLTLYYVFLTELKLKHFCGIYRQLWCSAKCYTRIAKYIYHLFVWMPIFPWHHGLCRVVNLEWKCSVYHPWKLIPPLGD